MWTAIDILIFGLSVYLLLYALHQPIVLFIIAIAVLYRIKWRSDKLIINDNEIQIINSFTTTKTTVEMSRIEKYAFNAEPIMGERLLIISDNMVVAKIRHKNYSNLNELLDYLDTKLKGSSSDTAQQEL